MGGGNVRSFYQAGYMQELCQLCEDATAKREDSHFGPICERCYWDIKWERWHERNAPVLKKA